MECHMLLSPLASSGESFDRTLAFDPDEARELVPVTTSGLHAVSVGLETDTATSGTWWSCPPRGPANVVVDATGTVSLRVAGSQPGWVARIAAIPRQSGAGSCRRNLERLRQGGNY